MTDKEQIERLKNEIAELRETITRGNVMVTGLNCWKGKKSI